MLQRLERWILVGLMSMAIAWGLWIDPVHASPDPYIAQYLKVQADESALLKRDAIGNTQDVNYLTLLKGKELFGRNCQSCHVGGSTLASPDLPLSLAALQGATPPRDSIESLVTYMRHPLSYTGDDENYGCREIAETWLNTEETEAIAAFVLRAATIAPGWGTKDF